MQHKASFIDKLFFFKAIFLVGANFWITRKIPKSILILLVFGLGVIGSRYLILLDDVAPFIKPSIDAILEMTPDAPLVIACWSYIILFVACSLQIKRAAFYAAMQLYRRFGVVMTP